MVSSPPRAQRINERFAIFCGEMRHQTGVQNKRSKSRLGKATRAPRPGNAAAVLHRWRQRFFLRHHDQVHFSLQQNVLISLILPENYVEPVKTLWANYV
jgi:hypothetical protein